MDAILMEWTLPSLNGIPLACESLSLQWVT